MFTPLNLILLLIIAFVIFRLRGVLGQRNPEDSPDRKPANKPEPEEAPIIVENLAPDSTDAAADMPADIPTDIDAKDGRGIALFRQMCPTFDEKTFLDGAARAYEMILRGFAADDLTPVRALLGDDVAAGFTAAIDDRRANHKRLITKILKIDRPCLEDALIVESDKQNYVQLEVRFRADIISYLTAEDSAAAAADLDADAQQAAHTSDDLWVFEQPLANLAPPQAHSKNKTPENSTPKDSPPQNSHAGWRLIRTQ